MMDRGKKGELPRMQVDFIDTICLPVYKVSPLSTIIITVTMSTRHLLRFHLH